MKYFDIIGRSKIWFTLSGVLVVASIVGLIGFGLELGIDFTGGSLIDIRFETEQDAGLVEATVEELGYDTVVQSSDENGFIVRLETIDQVQHNEILTALETIGPYDELRFDSVGPVIGEELKKSSLWALIILLVLIVLYVAWAFRKVSEPVASWKYGLLTIVAAAHDVIIPIGVFALLGHLFGFQIDTAFIAALLTILGYSINDTIVIFDRTRENLMSNRHSDQTFAETVNKSVMQSFARSINTSITTLFVLVAIFLFGGETTKPFILALIIGVVSGAYSSIFLASPLLVWWEKKMNKE
ncbi:protein translocase subunit SecF [Candidatus Uhrbacteria bacterium]|jgi:preprotein translocase subunit SecF|nr:protein translocase subunit SecF [Candidatus Uhrbacteria bacterium]